MREQALIAETTAGPGRRCVSGSSATDGPLIDRMFHTYGQIAVLWIAERGKK
jgi:hypothetical protein